MAVNLKFDFDCPECRYQNVTEVRHEHIFVVDYGELGQDKSVELSCSRSGADISVELSKVKV